MDTIFNLELLRSVYVFKDLNSSIKDVNTSLEKTTSSIRSLSDSFSSFTKSSVEKVKELSSEFKELTKSISTPQFATISFDTSGAMNEFSKISSMAQNFSELSYKETVSQSTRILKPNSGEEEESQEKSFFEKTIDVINKVGEVAESLGNIFDFIEKIRGKGNDSESGSGATQLLPALGESISGLIQKALPRIRTAFTAIRVGLSSVMASVTEIGMALLAIPGIGEILLVVAAVVALVIAIKQLWEHSKRFREMIGYIEGAGRAVFHNIGIYATRLWQLAIKPLIDNVVSGFIELFSFIGAAAKATWSGIVTAFNVTVLALKAAWAGIILAFKIAVSTITTTVKAAWSGIVLAFNIVVLSLKTTWNGFVTGFKIAISTVVNTAKAAWSGIVMAFNVVVLTFKAGWNKIISGFTSVFSFIGGLAEAVWSGIVSVFSSVWKFIVSLFKSVIMVFKTIWSAIISVFKGIWNVIVGVWSGMTEIFSKFKAWIYDAILNPIIETFSGVWTWITGLIERIISRLNSLFEPVKKLLKEIFSSEGTININEEGKKISKEKGEEFDIEKLQQKKEKEQEERTKNSKAGNGKPKKEDVFGGDMFNTKLERQLNMKNFGASALSNVQSRNSAFGGKGSMSGGSGMGGQKSVGNLNITKLIENMNIYNQNGTMSKDAIIQMVREALLTAVADFTLAQKDTY
ncbi:phage tail protein [Chryseobacterium limigenitum]|uniref:Phage-related protein n=1 Tax=Chryseobacterium limigenitum TaxID=1612149 RepID=A0A1K2IRX7_9FLAO|nr:hypothetical protein [Chryseobacterium limigenitum]SFZ95127.1 Phage-related protein [Chryseobacterium limigenitum]